jgi:hypothetical protein
MGIGNMPKTKMEVWMVMANLKTMKAIAKLLRGIHSIQTIKKVHKMDSRSKTRTTKSKARINIQAPNFKILKA